MSDVDFIQWVPKSLPKAHIQGMELEGSINSLCQVECSQEKSLHHGLNTNNAINQLYKILYVTVSCPTILHNISFHWYKTGTEDFICLQIKAF